MLDNIVYILGCLFIAYIAYDLSSNIFTIKNIKADIQDIKNTLKYLRSDMSDIREIKNTLKQLRSDINKNNNITKADQ